MSEAPAPVQTQSARRCPACGRVSAASDRCLNCWRDIAAVPLLPAEEAASALKVEARLARRRELGRMTPMRVVLLGVMAVIALFAVWWVYAAFIDRPPRPDAPSSTARSATAGAWSTQNGDNRGTRSTPASAHLGGIEGWRAVLGSPAVTAPVTDGRIVVVAQQDGHLVALESSSGRTLWAVRLTLDNPPLSAPTIAGDRIFITQREGLVLALDATDGKEIWRAQIAGPFEASPLIVDGIVYAYSAVGLFAFDAEDGRILWKHTFDPGWANVVPAVEGVHLAIAAGDRAIVFDRTTGQVAYSVTFSRSQPSSITIREGEVVALYGRVATVFAASTPRPWWHGLMEVSVGGETVRSFWFRLYLYKMAPAVPSETTMWDVTSLPRRTLAAATGEGAVFVASAEGAVTALGRADGRTLWTAKTNRLAASPIITADGVLLTEQSRLVLLDPATGQQRAERKVEGLRFATPSESATYLATDAGDVIALR